MLNSLLKRALGLERAVVEGARIEGDSIIVSVRPRRAAPRCPVCGRRCAAYDRLRPRRWRAPDLGSSRCHLEYCYRYSEIGQARQRPTAIRATANYPTASPAAPPSRAGIRFH